MKRTTIIIAIISLSIITASAAVYYTQFSPKAQEKKELAKSKKKDSEAIILLRKLGIKYKSTESYYGDINYSIVDGKGSGTPVESFQGVCSYDQHNYYIKSISSIDFINDTYKVLIDEDDKRIYVSKRDSFSYIGGATFFNPRNLDSIGRMADGLIDLEKSSDILYIISYVPSLQPFDKVSVSFDPNTLEIQQMKMWLESYTDADVGEVKEPILVSTYSNQKFGEGIPQDLIKTEKYFTVINTSKGPKIKTSNGYLGEYLNNTKK